MKVKMLGGLQCQIMAWTLGAKAQGSQPAVGLEKRFVKRLMPNVIVQCGEEGVSQWDKPQASNVHSP